MVRKKKEEGEEMEGRALELALAGIEKQYGKGAAFIYGEAESLPIPVFKTGSLKLDEALGAGGYPKGRIIEVYGPESCGKTTLALHAIAEIQRTGGTCAFIDAEHALDINYAKALGVDIEKLVFSQPTTGEQALGIVDYLTKSKAIDLIVIDSVAALVPQAELEGDVGANHVGRQARLMGQFLRKISGAAATGECTIFFINQIRMKIGVMFGNPETTPGGMALKFYSSCRIDMRKIGTIRNGTDIVANKIRIRIVKNKVGRPYREFETSIIYGLGIDTVGEILDLAIENGIIERSSSWFTVPFWNKGTNGESAFEEVKLQGEENVKDKLRSCPTTLEYIKSRLAI